MENHTAHKALTYIPVFNSDNTR